MGMPGKAKRMVYLDNASTTFPKPECVYAETMEQFRRLGVSPSRGCYSAARQMNEIVQSVRLSLAELFAQFARYYTFLGADPKVSISQSHQHIRSAHDFDFNVV